MATSWRCFLSLVAIVLLWEISFAENPKPSNDICAEKDKPGFILNLTSAMIFPGYLLVIDSNYLVYKVPRESLDSYGSMTFNIPGVYIESKWPAFKGNALWANVKTNYTNIYHFMDTHNNLWIFMDIMVGRGLRYNLQEQYIAPGFKYTSGIREQLIINDQATRIYSIQMGKDKLPLLFVWKFTFTKHEKIDDISSMFQPYDGFQMFYLVNKRDSSIKNLTVFNLGPNEKPVYPPEHNPLVNLSAYKDYRLENISDWHFDKGHIPVGFIYKGFFHLFDFDKIMIFADAMQNYEKFDNKDFKENKGELLMSVKMNIISVKDFFQCGSSLANDSKSVVTYPPTQVPIGIILPTQGRPLLLYILIGVGILVVFVVIALVVYSCTSSASHKKHHHKKHHGAHKKDKKKEEKKTVSTAVGSLKQASTIKEKVSICTVGTFSKNSRVSLASASKNIFKVSKFPSLGPPSIKTDHSPVSNALGASSFKPASAGLKEEKRTSSLKK